jgi:trehalose 6-phosphate synthase
VAFPPEDAPAGPDKAALLKEIGVKAEFLAVGVDRIDYTKGLIERFQAVERFLEKYPAYQGKFTFVELGAPSRTHIKRYHDFMGEVEQEADRINWKFKAKQWKPIVFLKKHHNPPEILPFYRQADVCLVTSLHDGMNLVAKEYVCARNDNGGALILSRFAGASRELREALMVNPYDIEQMADAIRFALEMDPEDRLGRMRRMRETVREYNIYRWAGNMIAELTNVPLAKSASPTS